MFAPVLRKYIAGTDVEVTSTVNDAVERYVIERAGDFRGRHYPVGAVVFVGGRVKRGEDVVLRAKGYGRPRFGTVASGGYLGDSGEACSAARWEAAGAILEVVMPSAAERTAGGGEQLTLGWSSRRAA